MGKRNPLLIKSIYMKCRADGVAISKYGKLEEEQLSGKMLSLALGMFSLK